MKSTYNSKIYPETSANNSSAVKLLVHLSAKHGSHIRKLELKDVEKMKDFYEVIRNMPLLSDLAYSRVTFHFEDKLCLTCARDDLKIINLIRKCELGWFEF